MISVRIGLNRLANQQSTRGMATLQDIRLNSVKTIQKIIQSDMTKKAVKAAAAELRPPTPMEIPKAIGQAVRLVRERNWRNLTVREAWLNTLVATEIVCWFFVGECIGKGTLVGYQV